MHKGSLGSFWLGDALQADAAAGAQFEPNFHHLDAAKLVKQLPWRQGRGAGFEFVFEANPIDSNPGRPP